MSESADLYRVEFSSVAEQQLLDLLHRIAVDIDADAALRYVERVERTCAALDFSPRRGTRLEQGPPELWLLPSHDGRYCIYFTVDVKQRLVRIRAVWGGGASPPRWMLDPNRNE